MRGLARAVGGLLQTGVDLSRRLGELCAGRHDDLATGVGSVDCTGNDRRAWGCHHDAPEQLDPGQPGHDPP